MIEGGSSRSFTVTKQMMYRDYAAWSELMQKLIALLGEFGAAQARAGADVVQVFDSWVGCLAPNDYRELVLPHTKRLIAKIRSAGVPVIYFGTDTATLLRDMQETGAEVIGVDWRIPLDEAWQKLGPKCGIQGNLDPTTLFADEKLIRARAECVLRRAGGRAGHIFNLGHGVLPETPVENVKALVGFVHEFSAQAMAHSGESK
jgi:uroporphyrinogen decarboxylase